MAPSPQNPLLPAAPRAPTPDTVVFPPRHLGGLVRSLPVLEVLAASGRALAILTPGEFHPLVRAFPGVVKPLSLLESEDATVSSIRRSGCKEAVLLDDSLDAAWLAYNSALDARWGYTGWLRRIFLHPAVPRDPRLRHGPEKYAALLEAMGLPQPESWTPRLHLPEDVAAQGATYLERAHVVETGGPLVGLAPTSDVTVAARWPWQNFAELARALRRRTPAVRQILLAGSDELWPVVRIHEETAHFYPVLGPDLTPAALAAVIARLDLLITVESGLMHLAAALGIPCLALFGSRNPTRHGPLGPTPDGRHHNILCSPQTSALDWVLYQQRKLRGLEVQDVLELTETLLFGAVVEGE